MSEEAAAIKPPSGKEAVRRALADGITDANEGAIWIRAKFDLEKPVDAKRFKAYASQLKSAAKKKTDAPKTGKRGRPKGSGAPSARTSFDPPFPEKDEPAVNKTADPAPTANGHVADNGHAEAEAPDIHGELARALAPLVRRHGRHVLKQIEPVAAGLVAMID